MKAQLSLMWEIKGFGGQRQENNPGEERMGAGWGCWDAGGTSNHLRRGSCGIIWQGREQWCKCCTIRPLKWVLLEADICSSNLCLCKGPGKQAQVWAFSQGRMMLKVSYLENLSSKQIIEMDHHPVVATVLSLSGIRLFCNATDSSPPGSCVHGVSQARVLEQGAISYSRGSSPPRDRTHVSAVTGGFVTH